MAAGVGGNEGDVIAEGVVLRRRDLQREEEWEHGRSYFPNLAR
jgi:hypothetical protein